MQPSLSITGEVNTTADTLLDAKDKIFVRVITAQASNKIAVLFHLFFLEGTASDSSAALCCGLVQYLPPPSWYDRSSSTFKSTNSPPSVRWRNVLYSSNSSISSPAAMVTVNENATN